MHPRKLFEGEARVSCFPPVSSPFPGVLVSDSHPLVSALHDVSAVSRVTGAERVEDD